VARLATRPHLAADTFAGRNLEDSPPLHQSDGPALSATSTQSLDEGHFPLNPSPMTRSEMMARIRAKDTKPEMAVRRLAHGMGFRFRLHRRDLPGSPDLVFPRLQKAIFVHGCFWHLHRDPGCRNAVIPKTRTEWWTTKLERNRRRDEATEAALRALGWDVLVIWECEVRAAKHEERLTAFLGRRAAIRPAEGSPVEDCLPPSRSGS
jgi:DNA mismatch endonuclease, patch repair protein